ncbi:cupin-like domain-containing protein [Sphingomonas sp. LB-2]|uniref:cupin-like domain-containing protein n=1 Tax=Sphingomonas caeni TaxID=2984949 RepID=UPI00222F3217|nr:cupin-like domain-containing protein [Sphingomonas caeni]MCW3848262.1 cupin-like domain-containing protein [Sphingomonas caeni]
MAAIAARTREVFGVDPAAIPYAELLGRQEPVILKGVARDWPLVKAGLESPRAAMAYLKRFDSGRPVTGYAGAPEICGRFFYNDDATAMNFEAGRLPLAEFLASVEAHLGEAGAPSFYLGSTDLDLFLPGLRAENDLALNDPMFAANPVIVSLWAGNRTTASAHYDMSNNMAVCVAGHRRFTLFPPDQVANLYPGPLEPTPGGQVVSMVDFRDPDRARYPRFAEAEAAGQVAELEPGDLLFYPALWWHHVEALDDFNLLINYWWNTSPAFIDTPQNTLLHALLSLRDRPEPEKAAWKALFDYYIFGPADLPAAHLPEAARGNLGPLDEIKARRLRAMLLNKLNR